MSVLLGALIGYFMGSIPCGLVFVKAICGIDIRQYGSHNIGTTNVFRTVGARMASLVLLGDLGKGVVACWLAVLCPLTFGRSLLVQLPPSWGTVFPVSSILKADEALLPGLVSCFISCLMFLFLPSPYGLPSSLSHAMSRWVPLWLPFAHLLAPII